MIDFISTWVQGIVVTVVIATIIEMILPNGNSKKYIKMVIGIFIVFNIVSPIINKFTGKSMKISDIVDIEKYIEDENTYKTNTKNIENTNNSNIKEMYIVNLKKDIKSKIEAKDYIVDSIQIDLKDDETYDIKNINMAIHKKEENAQSSTNTNIKEIEKVNIDINSKVMINENNKSTFNIENDNTLSLTQINEIKEYINSNYEIDKENIYINR